MCVRAILIGLLSIAGWGEVRVAGRVTSDTNAPIAGAAVTFRGTQGERYRALSDPAGAFIISLPQAGDYTAAVERTGYFALTGQKVTAGAAEIVFVLNPIREFADSVDVSSASSAAALDSTTSETGLSGADLMDVPYPTTHNFKAAMRILPGVVQDPVGGIHVNGGNEDQVLYLMDGFNIGDPLTNTLQSRVSVESVQSMEVMSGRFSAEYGKGSAGVLSVNTKMGDDRLRYSATNFVPGVESVKGWRIGSWNPRLNLSGPLRQGRAWFSDSLTAQYDQTVIRELPAGKDEGTSWRFNNLLRTQVNLSPSNIFYAGLLVNQFQASRSGLTALDPAETTVDRRSRQYFADVKDQIYLPGRAVLEFGYASNRTFAREIPQGPGDYITTPNGRRGNYFVNGTQGASRDQWLANAFLPVFHLFGEHQLKAGLDLDHISYEQDLRRTAMDFYGNQSLVRRVTFVGSGRVADSNFESAAYVQDGWRVRNNVLVELGLRADRDELLKNWNASPRFGIAWSPFGLENTKISGGYGITYDATNLQLFARSLDQTPVTTFYPPYGNGDISYRSMFVVPGQHFASPRYSTWSAALDQRIWGSTFVKLQAMRRRGDQGLTYEGTSTAGDSIYTLANARADAYDSFEITVRQNLRKQYEWLASYTRSRAASNAVIDLSADQPALVNKNFGRLPWDAPNRLVSWGYLPAYFKDWAIAYLAEYRTGFPFSVQNDAGWIVGPVNAHRYPNFFELDLHVEKKFRFHGQLWAARAGLNNITNHQNPNAVINNIDSDHYLNFFGGQHRATVFRIRWLGKL